MYLIEKIVFNLLAFVVFVIIFGRFIKKNDTSYVYILGLEFLGIVINFLELIFNIHLNLFFRIIIWILSIIIPTIILVIEYKKKIDFPEILNIILAKIALSSGNTEQAKIYLFNIINKYPKSYIGHKTLAEVYEKEEKYSVAIDEYIRATEINNKDIRLNCNIAKLLSKDERVDEAINILQDVLKKKPDFLDASNLLGEILYTNEKYKEAINVYVNALRYNPGNYDLYYNLGMVCTMVNDFQRAKEFYKKAAEINSLLYNAKLSIGQIALIEGDLDEAEKYFSESIKGEDVEAGSYYYLAQVAILKGDKEKATNYMNIAIELDSKIYDKVQRENVFIPIKNDIRKPEKILKEEKRKNKLLAKERKVLNHLSKTCSLISNLNNDDFISMKKLKEKELQKEEKQREN